MAWDAGGCAYGLFRGDLDEMIVPVLHALDAWERARMTTEDECLFACNIRIAYCISI